MNRLRFLTALMPVVAVLAASQWCFANSSITLISSGGGIYDYGLTVTTTNVTFSQNQTITPSGLSGVTAASATGTLGEAFTVGPDTLTSAVFAQTEFGFVIFPPGQT